ncbi:12492_t:CDS:2, partial [Racocetra fulgida]
MSKEDNQEINLKNLDLNRTYTFEEFELINEQLKKNPIEVDGEPVDLFEFIDNKLVPMPQRAFKMGAVVSEIAAQLGQWNVRTRKNGIITSSQGGEPFSPIFVVEVENIAKQSNFNKLDSKFKDIYFAKESAVQLGNINGDEILPKFTLKIQFIEQVIEGAESSESESTEEQELNIKCPKCDE